MTCSWHFDIMEGNVLLVCQNLMVITNFYEVAQFPVNEGAFIGPWKMVWVESKTLAKRLCCNTHRTNKSQIKYDIFLVSLFLMPASHQGERCWTWLANHKVTWPWISFGAAPGRCRCPLINMRLHYSCFSMANIPFSQLCTTAVSLDRQAN